MKDTFNKIISDSVKPLMKDFGFKKSGLSFYKVQNDLIYLINIQNSTYNNYAQIDFYINCCIHSTEIDSKLGIEIKSQPKEYECYYGKRIEQITGFEKDRFTIKSVTDLIKLQFDLKTQLDCAINYLLNIDSTEKLADLMIEKNGLQNFQELLSFLLKTNRLDNAKRLITKLHKDFMSDSRWTKFEQKIIDILALNSSKLTIDKMIEK